jgi:hypothetical protein
MGLKPERPDCSIGAGRDRCEPGSPVPIPSRALDVEEAVVRIYFHLKSAHEVLLDVEGVEMSDPLNPNLVREAKRLRRRSPKGHQRSLREISATLSTRGFVNANGRPFSPSSIKAMIEASAR